MIEGDKENEREAGREIWKEAMRRREKKGKKLRETERLRELESLALLTERI